MLNQLKNTTYYNQNMSIYHKVFTNNSISTEKQIKELTDVMYTVDTFNRYRANVNIDNSPAIGTNTSLTDTQDTSIIPDRNDTLFWSCYIGIYGNKQYSEIIGRYGNAEMDEKIRISNSLQKNPNTLKNTNQKITKGKSQEIISGILVNAKISLDALPAICVYYKTRIILLKDDSFYLNICPNDEYEKTILIRKTKDNKYSIDLDITEDKISNIENNCILLDHHDKPLKAISNFKIDELNELADILHIDRSVKMSKTELYGVISRKCKW